MLLLFLFIVLVVTFPSCSNGQDDLLAHDVELYKNTPAWELAKAVEKQDTTLIKEICRNDSSLINFQENKFGQTLLEWSVYTDKYNSAKALAEMGANPNIQSNDGTSALIHAADKISTSKYLRLLLKHDADVNTVADTSENQPRRTPLITAAKTRLESVKLLVEAGADINYEYNGYCALEAAATQNKIEIVKYLIDEGANFKKPLDIPYDNPQYDTLFLQHKLRYMEFPIGSHKHKIKMQVVETLKAHGMDYRKTEIPATVKENHNDEYLKNY